jgi:HlyD family secretion protein
MDLLLDIWNILTPRQRRWLLAGQALALLMALSTVTGIASITPFFSVLGDPRLTESNPFLHWLYGSLGFSDRRHFVVALGLGFIALVLLANLINLLGSSAMNRLAWWIGTDLQSALFSEYLGRPYQFHARTHSAVLLNNIVTETAAATNEILLNGLTVVTNVVTAACILLAMLLLSPAIAVVMMVALGGGYVLIYFTVRNRLLVWGRIKSEAVVEETRVVSEGFGAIKEILVLGIQDFFRRGFERASNAATQAIVRTQQVGQAPKHIMECIAVAGLAGLALVLSGRDGGVGPWLGQLTFAGFAAYRLLPALQQAFAGIVRVRAARAGFASIAPDLRRARARSDAADVPDAGWRHRPRTEIALHDVSFCYATDRPAAVRQVSLRIAARAAVGLVGANGSGKTTLIDLLAGLLVPETGEVRVDGVALDYANRAAWRSRIAYVPQNIFLLDTTIAQNVALGVARDSIDRQRLLAAARLAQLDEFVETLPNGYDHRVGERGLRLSGGQRQKVGIARALYTEASVLILDEATNALDGLTEQELVATIVRLRGRYTIVLIAHRLNTLRACDAIFEMQNGQVVASGTYSELLANSEAFRRMAALG